jgi:RNA polymerase sigma-70 factor (ECF subfamily)
MVAANAFHNPLDPVVLARARRGDAAAIAAIYAQYQRACFNLALRVLGETAAAEDVVQDVFVRLFDNVRSFRGDAPFGAWLRRLVANATIDELRRRQWLLLDPEGLPEPVAGPALTGLAEEQIEAWQLLMRLSPRARAVLVLHEVEGYTHRELAELFGQSESYSKSILARAIHRLQSGARAEEEDVEGHERDRAQSEFV